MVAVRPGQSRLSQAGLGAGSPGASRRYWSQNSRANRRSRTKAGARDFLISGPFCAILRHLGLLALRLGSGQARSTPRCSVQGRLLRLGSGQAPSTRLRAGSFDSAQGRLLRLGSGRTEAGCWGLALILIMIARCIPGWEGRGVSRRVNAEGAENAEFFDGLGSL